MWKVNKMATPEYFTLQKEKNFRDFPREKN